MKIRDMFEKDINRKIEGVIKVDQDQEEYVKQEVEEYVITKELKKHFLNFFDYYSESFNTPTSDIGVWISGFFGSGKSHFLKMLSYILEDKKIDGVPVVEYFREKFADDPTTFMLIDNSTKHDTETILFNIDVEGSINKDKTAVLRVFAKMFYDHLGYYGENLKVAKLEQYIESQGKTEEFRRVFEEKKGQSWIDQRKAFAFNGKTIIPTLMEVLDMSEEDAQKWFNDKSSEEFSIADLVEDIKAYVDSKPEGFRLLFMADEVGQYVGTDTDMLLNLQSLTEKIGSECLGKVWIICTGQEAIDEIIRVRADEFSRIQARFKIRLSLSSSSVDEVIQKRILSKTPKAEKKLEEVYELNDAALRNLFTFKDAVLDIKGYSGPGDFAINYPFVPYQFIIMQKVFFEVRKHGNAGKHLSGAARSMLSSFQEAAQQIQDQDEHALVPFFRFYDTMYSFLDSSIRGVIDRCTNAAESDLGLEKEDVDTLKLLYLLRYIDDIPANLDNIVILLADDIRIDKIAMREKAQASLDRLLSQNYIGRTGEVYNFLTDEEQDVAKEIKITSVDTSMILDRLGNMIFNDIYPAKKYRYGDIYDFPFDKMIDKTAIGSQSGGMTLQFLTVATDDAEKSSASLMMGSKGKAVVVLPKSPYYDSLENALKIRKYVKQKNVTQLPKSMQDIIRHYQDEAAVYEAASKDALINAIENADFYVDGEKLDITNGNANSRIDQALEYLVSHVYSGLELITKNAQSDADINAILSGDETSISGMEQNGDAAAKVEEYLDIQQMKNLPTSMADVQSRFQAVPYGWREIDIAAVVAQLIFDQKVTIKYGGMTIQPDDSKLPDMLRKKSEIGKTSISKRVSPPAQKMQEARNFLRDYFDVMDVPGDENGLISYIVKEFTDYRDHLVSLDNRYDGKKYPDRQLIQQSIELVEDVLSQQKDNNALIDRLLEKKDALEESKEQLQHVEGFFTNQVQIFDAAVTLESNLRNELDYLSDTDANEALNQIRLICAIDTGGNVDYKRIPELNSLMDTVNAGHDKLLEAKRDEILEVVRQCMEALHTEASGNVDLSDIIRDADNFYDLKKQQINELTSLALLDGLIPQMLQYNDSVLAKIEALSKPAPPVKQTENPPKTKYKAVNRSIVFPQKKLKSKEDIEVYIEEMREKLEQMLQDCDGIDLK